MAQKTFVAGDVLTASDTNLKFRPPDALQRYFDKVEPDIKLVIPAKSTSQVLK